MDAAYDSSDIYEYIFENTDCIPVIDTNRRKGIIESKLSEARKIGIEIRKKEASRWQIERSFAIEFTKNYAMLGALNLFCIISRYDNKKDIRYYSKYKDESIYIKLFKYENKKNFAVMSSSVAYEMGFIDGNGKN